MIDDGAAVRRALGSVFWGTLLVLLDLRLNGFDVLPDVVGWVLVAVALGRCRRACADASYRDRVTAALVLAWVAAGCALGDVVGHLSGPPGVVYAVITVAEVVVTAWAFARLATVVADPLLERTWATSVVLLLAGAAGALAFGRLHVGLLVFFTVVVNVVAVVYYLVAIARTRRRLSSAAGVP